jgi:hypothetical protein
MKFRDIGLIGFIIFLTAGVLFWSFRLRVAHAEVPARWESTMEPWNARFLRIEEKAKAAETSDLDSVRALAEEIFDQPHVFGAFPDFVKESAKERVVRAELAYRQGQGKPVTHADVVHLINKLADVLSLPSYAKTSEHQLIDMRFHSMQFTPSFMGSRLSEHQDGTPLRPGERMNSNMSPLQACYLAMSAVDAKLINVEYQVPPEEWEAYRYHVATKAWHQPEKPRPTLPKLTVVTNYKQMELIRTAEAHLLRLNQEESTTLIHSVLDTLGIPR